MLKYIAAHRLTFPLAVLAIIGIGLLASAAHFHNPINSHNNGSYRLPASAGPYAEDIDFTLYGNDGTKKMSITGKKITSASARAGFLMIGLVQTVEIKDAVLTIYEKNAPCTIISSRTAALPAAAGSKDAAGTAAMFRKIDFSGDCRVVTNDHRAMACDRLKWFENTGRLLGIGGCELNYDGKTVMADTITTDLSLKNYSISNNKNRRLKSLARKAVL